VLAARMEVIMKIVKFGIIGAGGIANKFVQAVNITKGAQLIAASSKSMERAKSLANKFNLPFYYDSYEEMLINPEIDAVYIATTNNFHYENCMICLDYNKPIICEKPLAISKQQATEIFAKAKQKKIFVMEAMWSRFLPVTQKVRSLVKERKIGEVKLIDVSFGINLPFNPEKRHFNPELAGGALFDLGVYPLEYVMYITGECISDVNGFANIGITGVDELEVINAKFPSGIVASIKCALNCTTPHYAYIFGSKGYIKVTDFMASQHCELFNENSELIEEFKYPFENGFEFEIAEAVKCINSGKLESEIITHEDTIACAGVFDELRRQWGIK
jgi:predicted dehydrogenase